MDLEMIKKAINNAKEIANNEKEYRSEIFLGVLISEIMNNRPLNQSPELQVPIVEQVPRQKPVSLREFVLSKQPKNDVQRTILYAYFMEHYQGKTEGFTRQDIVNAFRTSKDPVPQNPDDKIQKCIAKGWLTKGTEKGIYTITNTGIKAVEENFNGE